MSLDFWKVIGLAGTGLFAGRWALQSLASRRAKRPVVPPTFWLTSLAGSLTLILYFTLSPYRDLVGVMGNLLPAFVSSYNLLLVVRARKQSVSPAAVVPVVAAEGAVGRRPAGPLTSRHPD